MSLDAWILHSGHAKSLNSTLGAEYSGDTHSEQQLARATEQHIRLKHALAQQYHKVSLYTILIGVMGTIYKCHTISSSGLPLNKLGLDRCRVRKLPLNLKTQSIQYATKIINSSRRLKNIKEMSRRETAAHQTNSWHDHN